MFYSDLSIAPLTDGCKNYFEVRSWSPQTPLRKRPRASKGFGALAPLKILFYPTVISALPLSLPVVRIILK